MALKKPVVITSGQMEQLQTADATTGNGSVPAGGTANQVLSKVDSTDYNLQWSAPGGGSGLSLGVVLMCARGNYQL